MYLENEIIRQFNEKNIMVYEVESDKDDFCEEIIFLVGATLQNFCEFTVSNGIKNVFQITEYYDPETFLIEEDYSLDQTYEVYKLLMNKIKLHNKRIEEIDFTRPIRQVLFCIYNGEKVGIISQNFWHIEEGLRFGSEVYSSMVEEYEEEISKMEEDKKNCEEELRRELKEELTNIILNDKDFENCSNQSLRLDYLNQLWNRKDMEKFRPLFLQQRKFFHKGDGQNFIDLIWKKRKA